MSREKELEKELVNMLIGTLFIAMPMVAIITGTMYLISDELALVAEHEPTLAAAVLMTSIIAASTAVAVMVYLWFTRARTGATGAVQAAYTASKLQIVGASLSSALKTSTVYVQNIGDVNANITMALLIDPATQNVVCSNTLNQAIPAGSVASITIQWGESCNIKSGYTYVIKLATKDGAMFTTQLAAS